MEAQAVDGLPAAARHASGDDASARRGHRRAARLARATIALAAARAGGGCGLVEEGASRVQEVGLSLYAEHRREFLLCL